MSAKIFKRDSRITYPIKVVIHQESAFINYLFVENLRLQQHLSP
jgi:hypothetical protein